MQCSRAGIASLMTSRYRALTRGADGHSSREGVAALDGQRFDAVTRSLVTRQTRRGSFRRLAAAAGALIAIGRVLVREAIARIPAIGVTPARSAAPATAATTGAVSESD